MNLKNYKKKLRTNRYLGKMRMAVRYPAGIRRTFALIWGGISECLKHKFKIWDYEEEVGQIKKNEYEYSFVKDGIEVKFYLPQYEIDYLQGWIANYADFSEYCELEKIKSIVGKHKDILDIGANIGNHTVYFGKIMEAHSIHSFEPMKEFFRVLEKNVTLNQLNPFVKLHNVALGKKSGTAKIKLYDPRALGSTQIEESDEKEGDMTLRCLDDFEFDNIDFVKIDVETFEYDLLLGAEKTLRKHSPLIFIEIFDEFYPKVDQLLRQYGYNMVREISHTNYLYKKVRT